MSLQWTLHSSPDRIEVRLSGIINEAADFASLLDPLEDGALRLDLSGITLINSCGIREWVRFVARLDRPGRDIEFVRCSPAIVRQLNLISNFCGPGVVRSVLLPYFCDACGVEITRGMELDDAQVTVDEVIACEGCGGEAEFDDLVDRYLAFAMRR